MYSTVKYSFPFGSFLSDVRSLNDVFDPKTVKSILDKTTSGYPLTDLYQENDCQVIEIALAGFDKKDLQIDANLAEGTLTVSADPRTDASTEGQTDRNRRIAARKFSKTFVDVYHAYDLAKATSTFVNGLLVITLPKKEKHPGVKIEIG